MKAADIFPWIVATLIGAAVPALLNALLSSPYFYDTAFIFAFIVALGHAVVLGLPLALLYRSQQWTGVAGAILGGFLIGAIPYGFAFLPRSPPDRVFSSVDWLSHLELTSLLGGFGAAGALAFWLTLRAFGVLKAAEPATPDSGAF